MLEAGRRQVALERPELPEVGAERHDAEVGLVAEQGDRHDLQAGGLRRLDRLLDRRAVRQRRRLGEQVEHALAGPAWTSADQSHRARGCRRLPERPTRADRRSRTEWSLRRPRSTGRWVHRSFMLIAFDDGSAVHELEVVVHDPDATVADLVRALDPTQAHRSLAVDGIRRPADRRLDRAAITTGATVPLDGPLAPSRRTFRRPADRPAPAARHPARGRRPRGRRAGRAAHRAGERRSRRARWSGCGAPPSRPTTPS